MAVDTHTEQLSFLGVLWKLVNVYINISIVSCTYIACTFGKALTFSDVQTYDLMDQQSFSPDADRMHNLKKRQSFLSFYSLN